jgi:hypothetical protein
LKVHTSTDQADGNAPAPGATIAAVLADRV